MQRHLRTCHLRTCRRGTSQPGQGRARALAAGPIIGFIITGAALAGCTGGGAGGSSASSSAASAQGAAPPAAAAPAGGSAVHGDANGDSSAGSSSGGSSSGGSSSGGGAAAGGAGGSGQSATAARLAPAGQQIIYTAQLTVRAANVQDAVAQATTVAAQAGGYVSTEHAASDPDHPASATATVTLKIPVAAYQGALGRLSGPSVGTRLSLAQQAQDVTQQVADVASQVTSDEAAIAQLRALLKHAASVGELLQVQNQINSDESSLEAMQAQQRALDHETSYATVTVTIVGPKAAVAKPKAKKAAPPGLASGANGGWHAFTLTIDWILAILGAIAPFAAAVAALAAAAWYLRRRLRRTPA